MWRNPTPGHSATLVNYLSSLYMYRGCTWHACVCVWGGTLCLFWRSLWLTHIFVGVVSAQPRQNGGVIKAIVVKHEEARLCYERGRKRLWWPHYVSGHVTDRLILLSVVEFIQTGLYAGRMARNIQEHKLCCVVPLFCFQTEPEHDGLPNVQSKRS